MDFSLLQERVRELEAENLRLRHQLDMRPLIEVCVRIVVLNADDDDDHHHQHDIEKTLSIKREDSQHSKGSDSYHGRAITLARSLLTSVQSMQKIPRIAISNIIPQSLPTLVNRSSDYEKERSIKVENGYLPQLRTPFPAQMPEIAKHLLSVWKVEPTALPICDSRIDFYYPGDAQIEKTEILTSRSSSDEIDENDSPIVRLPDIPPHPGDLLECVAAQIPQYTHDMLNLCSHAECDTERTSDETANTRSVLTDASVPTHDYSSLDSKTHPPVSGQIEIEVIFENQHWAPTFNRSGWFASAWPMRPHFSDELGNVSMPNPFSMICRPGWQWNSSWCIDTPTVVLSGDEREFSTQSEATLADFGWQYAVRTVGTLSWHSQMQQFDTLRRRRWSRQRVYTGRDIELVEVCKESSQANLDDSS